MPCGKSAAALGASVITRSFRTTPVAPFTRTADVSAPAARGIVNPSSTVALLISAPKRTPTATDGTSAVVELPQRVNVVDSYLPYTETPSRIWIVAAFGYDALVPQLGPAATHTAEATDGFANAKSAAACTVRNGEAPELERAMASSPVGVTFTQGPLGPGPTAPVPPAPPFVPPTPPLVLPAELPPLLAPAPPD